MTRFLAIISILAFFVAPLRAETGLPFGEFRVVNTAGFSEEDGKRQLLAPDRKIGLATIGFQSDEIVQLEINGTTIQLYRLAAGLDGLSWNAGGMPILQDLDIEALNTLENDESVPAWGADIAWPGSGLVRMVMLPLGPAGYTGFLVSYPDGKTVVRQMEFRQVFGPLDRPQD